MALNHEGRLFQLYVEHMQEKPLKTLGKNVVITGLNGIGKSFYLKNLKDNLISKEVKTEQIENIMDFDLKSKAHEVTQALAQDIGFSILDEINTKDHPTFWAFLEIRHKFDRLRKDLNLQKINFNPTTQKIDFLAKSFSVEAEQLSAGQQIIFKLFLWEITNLAKKQQRDVVLWDEVENSLHPKFQKKLLSILDKAFPRISFVLVTHSPFIIDSALKRKSHWIVTVLDHCKKRGINYTIFNKFDKNSYDELKNVLAELGINALIWDLAFSEKTVFVEGFLDKEYFELLFDDDFKIDFFNCRGFAKFSYLNVFKEWFGKNFCSDALIIYDGDMQEQIKKEMAKSKTDSNHWLNCFKVLNINQIKEYECSYIITNESIDRDKLHKCKFECLILDFLKKESFIDKSKFIKYHDELNQKMNNKTKLNIKELILTDSKYKIKFKSYFENLKKEILKKLSDEDLCPSCSSRK